jgi:acetamidase/formamidase
MRQLSIAALLLSFVLPPVAAQTPAGKVHHLPATPETVAWGYYAASAKPVLRIQSGDIIEVETLLTSTPDRLAKAGVAEDQIQQSLKDVVARVTDKGPGGHILTGPVYVEGAAPGDVLEVRVLDVKLAIPYAYNGCSGFLAELCAEPRTMIIPLDPKRGIARFGDRLELPIKPFFGSMGVAPPPDSGRVSSNPPGIHAGNLDNKELVAGTTLYIPIHVAGALFEVGDGHALQGDGEVDQTGIETSLVGRLQLTVRKDLHLTWPRAETATHLITMGMDPDLKQATRIAALEMVDLLASRFGLSRMDAYRLASIAADLRITQLVDGNVGVHMMVAKSVGR